MKSALICRQNLAVILCTALCALFLHGCSSSSSVDSGTARYGTGAGNTKPYPQSSLVNVEGVGGATIRKENKSRSGNKNYVVWGKNYKVWNGYNSYIEEGTASWYGPGFNGNKTSNGEVYNQKGYTAAHKNLPLPSYLLVTNLTNGKKVIVRVNDRGPFHGDRIIDLSEGAARAINMVGKGTAKVRIEYLDIGSGNTIKNAKGTPKYVTSENSSDAYKNSVPVSYGSSYVKYDGKTTKSYTEAHAEQPKTSYSSAVTAPAVASGYYVQIVSTSSAAAAAETKDLARQRTGENVVVSTQGNLNRVLVGPYSEAKARQMQSALKAKGYVDSFIKKL